MTNASGSAHVCLCSECGASLTHVYYLDGRPLGSDCFERLTGLRVSDLRDYTDATGNVDLTKRAADLQARRDEFSAAEIRRAAQIADVAQANQWLIDALTPFAFEGNFCASIIASLRSEGILASELPHKARCIIVSILVKGLRGKRRDAMRAELHAKFESSQQGS